MESTFVAIPIPGTRTRPEDIVKGVVFDWVEGVGIRLDAVELTDMANDCI